MAIFNSGGSGTSRIGKPNLATLHRFSPILLALSAPPSPTLANWHGAQKAFSNRRPNRALRPNSTVQKPLSKRCQMARNPLPQTSAGGPRRVLSGALDHMRGFLHPITVIGCALSGADRKPNFATLTCFIMVHHAFRYRAGGPVGM